MTGRSRALCYTIEGMNAFAAATYLNYLYFFFRDRFGFSDRQNLELAAISGLICIVMSWQAGKFAHRHGYFTALKIGFGGMIAGLLLGAQLHSVSGLIGSACVFNAGMCFTWPVLEALVSRGASAARGVGFYNIIWAASNALAFFIGGTLIEKFGYRTIFYVPAALVALQLALVFWLEKLCVVAAVVPVEKNSIVAESDRPAVSVAKNFRRLAWLANPFAYIAINTLIAVLPGVAAKFHLSTGLAGFVCSLWCFARVLAFVVLWQWPGWHYRFRWLAGAFSLLILSFAAVLAAPSLAVMLVAQVFFGASIGLIYYSSLFYAMDGHEATSEHGGIHEAAIGVGNCLGPAVGATALWLAPQNAGIGVWAVSVMLIAGLGGLLWLRKPAK